MICQKMGCSCHAVGILSLPTYGKFWFCAAHTLLNLQWQIAYELEA